MAGYLKKSLNGVHIPHYKNTENTVTERMPIPDIVRIVMSQHIGPPCEPLVEIGEEVKVGQIIADTPDRKAGAPIHASVSGTVESVGAFVMPGGKKVKEIVIKADKEQRVHESVTQPNITDYDSFLVAVRASGMVGLGGAGFPTHIKYNPGRPMDTFLINAAECEPHITSDYMTIMEEMEHIIKGVEVITKHLGTKRCIIGIEDNKPKAIEVLKKEAAKGKFEVFVLPALYPQGAEKVLIYHALDKRVIPEGKFPADVGVIVSNITTVAALGNYFETGMPLTYKRMTVDGECVKNPKNVIAPIGTEIRDIVEFCGGFTSRPKKVLMGGPMMGVAVDEVSFPTIKNNNAILLYSESEAVVYDESQCIRCGRCVRACPMVLMPLKLKEFSENNDTDALSKYKVNLCIECGSCSFVCPARIDLVKYHRDSKGQLRSEQIRAEGKKKLIARRKAEREAEREADQQGKGQ